MTRPPRIHLQSAVETIERSNGSVSKQSPNFGQYMMLKIADLHSDGTYQRPTSPWRVRDIVFNYRAILFQPLIIGLRKGVYYVIDGLHRREAGEQLGFIEVPCMVYPTKNAAEEAKAFYELQKFRRRITPTQQFMARIAFGDQAAVTIADLLSKHKFEMDKYEGFGSDYKKNNVLRPISSLEKAYDAGGEKMVDHILLVLRTAWDGRAASLDMRIIRGLIHFMKENAYSVKSLADKLSNLAPYDLNSAVMSVSNAQGITEVMAMSRVIYNIYHEKSLKARGVAK